MMMLENTNRSCSAALQHCGRRPPSRCRVYAVAQPSYKTSKRSYYTDLIQEHKNAQLTTTESEQQHTVPAQSPPPNRTPRGVFSSPDSLLTQAQNTLGQVVTVTKQAVDELAAAWDPEQRQQQQQRRVVAVAAAAAATTAEAQADGSSSSSGTTPNQVRHQQVRAFSVCMNSAKQHLVAV